MAATAPIPGGLAVSAVATHGPSAPVGGVHTFVPITDPSATFKPAAKVQKAWELATTYRGKDLDKIDLEADAYKKIDAKDLESIWKEVTDKLGSGATDVCINMTKMYVRYTEGGKTRILDLASVDASKKFDPALLDLMKKVQAVSRKIWEGMKFHDPSSPGNRPADGDKPLQIVTDKWANAMPKSIEEFFKQGHFEQLCNMGVPPEEALRRIIEAEAFVQNLQKATKQQITDKEEEMKLPAFGNKTREEKDEFRQSLEALRKLHKELEGTDRFALYFAVGAAAGVDMTDQAKRLEVAEKVSNGIRAILSAQLKPGEDPNAGAIGWLKDKAGFGENAVTFIGLGPYVAAYAGSAGDLVLHDKLEAITRVEQDGTRSVTAPCLTEFVVHNVTHLGRNLAPGATFDTKEALTALGIKFDDATRDALVKAADDARAEASQAGHQRPGSVDPKSRTIDESLREHPGTKALAGKTAMERLAAMMPGASPAA